jgi:DNA-directed RNA polymerase I subunit RPA2
LLQLFFLKNWVKKIWKPRYGQILNLYLLLQLFWQTETINLAEKQGTSRTFRKSNLDKSCPAIDSDGLPHVGQVCHCLSFSIFSANLQISLQKIWMYLFQRIRPDEPYCSTYDSVTNKTSLFRKKGTEDAYIDSVAVDVKNEKRPLQKVSWKNSLLFSSVL